MGPEKKYVVQWNFRGSGFGAGEQIKSVVAVLDAGSRTELSRGETGEIFITGI